jgi:phage/plasmid-like protein (TIGR03299 family)
MSHELTTRESGLVEFAYNEAHGDAWHGLGQAVDADNIHDVDHWRNAAGMDWKVARSRVRFGEGANQRTMDDQHVLFRSDTKAPLGIVSAAYKIVQPRQVVEFFRDLVEAGGLQLSAMGTLQGGRRFWATAQIGEAAPVSVRDKIGGYVLLSTSADGSLATEARLTTVRTVCANTLAMARAEGKAAFKLSHRSVFDADRIKNEMKLNDQAWMKFRQDVRRLAEKQVDHQLADHIVARVLAGSDTTEALDKARASSRGYAKILDLFNGSGKGAMLDGVRGTAWGLLNAVTEYVDHHVASRTAENRFISAQWGNGADLKTTAFDILMSV